MKKNEFQQIKTKPEAELHKNLTAQRSELWALQRDLAAGKVTNVRKIRAIKKDIARILTVLHTQ